MTQSWKSWLEPIKAFSFPTSSFTLSEQLSLSLSDHGQPGAAPMASPPPAHSSTREPPWPVLDDAENSRSGWLTHRPQQTSVNENATILAKHLEEVTLSYCVALWRKTRVQNIRKVQPALLVLQTGQILDNESSPTTCNVCSSRFLWGGTNRAALSTTSRREWVH